MYTSKIGSLYLQKAKILFKDEYGRPLEEDAEILDNSIRIQDNSNEYSPDYYIRGFYRKIDHHSQNEFIISEGGTEVIFITGVPKDCPTLDPFRYKGPLFSSYYQDTVKGALLQIFKKANVYIGVTKTNGLLII